METEPSNEALNAPVTEDSNPSTPPADDTQTSPQSPAAGESEGEGQGARTEDAPADGDKGEHQQERPAQRRIRELANENRTLRDEITRFTQSPSQPQQSTDKPLSEILQGREEVDPAELDRLVAERAAQASNASSSLDTQKLRLEISQNRAVDQYETDQVRVEAKHAALNPESDQYNPTLERAVAETWKELAVQNVNGIRQINPNVRLTDVADRFMEAVQSAVERQTPRRGSQADDVSVTPTNTPPREDKAFEDLSTKEMEARLRSQGYKV